MSDRQHKTADHLPVDIHHGEQLHHPAIGHATAAFTLDVYGHVSERMKEDSAARMEAYIKAI